MALTLTSPEHRPRVTYTIDQLMSFNAGEKVSPTTQYVAELKFVNMPEGIQKKSPKQHSAPSAPKGLVIFPDTDLLSFDTEAESGETCSDVCVELTASMLFKKIDNLASQVPDGKRFLGQKMASNRKSRGRRAKVSALSTSSAAKTSPSFVPPHLRPPVLQPSTVERLSFTIEHPVIEDISASEEPYATEKASNIEGIATYNQPQLVVNDMADNTIVASSASLPSLKSSKTSSALKDSLPDWLKSDLSTPIKAGTRPIRKIAPVKNDEPKTEESTKLTATEDLIEVTTPAFSAVASRDASVTPFSDRESMASEVSQLTLQDVEQAVKQENIVGKCRDSTTSPCDITSPHEVTSTHYFSVPNVVTPTKAASHSSTQQNIKKENKSPEQNLSLASSTHGCDRLPLAEIKSKNENDNVDRRPSVASSYHSQRSQHELFEDEVFKANFEHIVKRSSTLQRLFTPPASGSSAKH